MAMALDSINSICLLIPSTLLVPTVKCYYAILCYCLQCFDAVGCSVVVLNTLS